MLMMTSGSRVDSAIQGKNGHRQRRTAQTTPHVCEGNHLGRVRLRRALQLNDWEMSATDQVADVEFQPVAATTTNGCLRPGTRRASRPRSPRLEPWFARGRPTAEVDLIRGYGVEGVARPVPVVPVNIQRQFPAQGGALVGDQQASRLLGLQRPDEPLDHGDAAVLADGSEALADACRVILRVV